MSQYPRSPNTRPQHHSQRHQSYPDTIPNPPLGFPARQFIQQSYQPQNSFQSRLQRPLAQISRVPQNNPYINQHMRASNSFSQRKLSPNETKRLETRARKVVLSRRTNLPSISKAPNLPSIRNRLPPRVVLQAQYPVDRQAVLYDLLQAKRLQSQNIELQKADDYKEVHEEYFFEKQQRSPIYSDLSNEENEEKSWKSKSIGEDSGSRSESVSRQSSESPDASLEVARIVPIPKAGKIDEDHIIELKKRLKSKALKLTRKTSLKRPEFAEKTSKISSLGSIKRIISTKKKIQKIENNSQEEKSNEVLSSDFDEQEIESEKIKLYSELKTNNSGNLNSEISIGNSLSSMLQKQYRINHGKLKRILEKLDPKNKIRETIIHVLQNEESEYQCHEMCSELEVKDREQAGEIDPLEMTSTKLELRPIKKFKRSAADTQLNDVHYIRPPFILLKTIQFIVKNIVSLIDLPNLLDVFTFVDNRFRAVCQDFTIIFGEKDKSLAIRSELFRCSKESILSYETMVRFYLVVLNELRFKHGQDEHVVMQPLSGILTTLVENYFESRKLTNEFSKELKLGY